MLRHAVFYCAVYKFKTTFTDDITAVISRYATVITKAYEMGFNIK